MGSHRCSPRSRAARPARRRRGSTRSRASGTTPTGSPTARSRTSTRCPTTPTGSCGCRSPTRTIRGIRPRANSTAATGATSTSRPVIPAARTRSNACSRRSRRTGSVSGKAASSTPRAAPVRYRPQEVTDDNIREINAMAHIMNELIDEACGRVLRRVAARGWDADTDVFFTTDHGELQGDYGLIFKGPFHTDSLMRLPMVWRPAPSAGIVGGKEITEPVGQLDLAPTFCEIAGVEPAATGCRARRCRPRPAAARERVLCEWDSQFPGYGMHMRSIYRDGLALHRVRAVDRRRAERARGVLRGVGHVRWRHRADQLGRVRRHRRRALRRRGRSAPVGEPLGRSGLQGRSAKTSSPTSTRTCRASGRC